MTLRCPSFFAAATRALNPPPVEADVAVDQFALELPELPPVAAVLELLDPLLQPAASKMPPIAAPTATIALVARKITLPMPPRPDSPGQSWLDKCISWPVKLNGSLLSSNPGSSLRSRIANRRRSLVRMPEDRVAVRVSGAVA